jgi:hypothetical protein
MSKRGVFPLADLVGRKNRKTWPANLNTATLQEIISDKNATKISPTISYILCAIDKNPGFSRLCILSP